MTGLTILAKTIVVAFKEGRKRYEVARPVTATVADDASLRASTISLISAGQNGSMVNWNVREATLAEVLALAAQSARNFLLTLGEENGKFTVEDDGEVLFITDTETTRSEVLAKVFK
jgi:hypothetical protein